MEVQANNLFTASQIARAAGLTRQAVHAGLQTVAPAGAVNSQGKDAAGWRFADLPMDWQLEITRRGVKRGFDNGEAFLAGLPEPWKCPLPWDRLPKHQQEKACKLQKALARPLSLRTDGTATASEVEQAGLQDFQAEFGYCLSGRHWRRLLHRTIERDAGEEIWQRLEIYLDERAFETPKPERDAVRMEYLHRELDEVLTALENRQRPTPADRQFLWDAVFRHYERQTETLADSPKGNRERRQFKASLTSYLFKAFPERTLCATEKSLRRRFDEKLDLWRQKGRRPEALQDARPLTSGNFRTPDFAADRKKIRDLAIQLDGNEALAHRRLRERGELSQEFCDYYPYDPRRDKSALPKSVRDAISSDVDMVLPLRRGPWQARMRGPYIQRDWSAVKPGDWFSADDVTWNHYFKERQAGGGWQILRGECLLMTDLRTGYPLDFLLIAGKYNGEHVRNLALKVHDRVGLPRCGFLFEGGIWQSRLVTGDHRQGTPVHWREAENGLCAQGLNLEVRRATTPRAKPIEGLLRIVQERMRCIPGFVGFNEREYDAEHMQALIARAHRGDEPALQHFPTMLEWRNQISAVLNEFAHDPQNGQMLQGLAPAEAWAEEIRQRALRQLPSEARYILSTHQKTVTVRQEGIVLTIRGQRLLYYNAHTGPLIGQEVLAFYNLELPQMLTCCDMKRQNYFSVSRVELPAMTATKDQFDEANRLRKAHMAPAKAIFGELPHEVVSTVTRDADHSEEVKELGRFHNEESERFQAERTEGERDTRRARREASAAGFDPNRLRLRNPKRAADAAQRIADRFAALKQKEANQVAQEAPND
jgi:hypothetical protein